MRRPADRPGTRSSRWSTWRLLWRLLLYAPGLFAIACLKFIQAVF